MEAIGDQFAGYGGTTAVLTHAASASAWVDSAFDGGTQGGLSARLGYGLAEAVGATESVGLAEAVALVDAAAAAAPDGLAMADYVEAADFAGLVEELSRTVDYLQILGRGRGPHPDPGHRRRSQPDHARSRQPNRCSQ
jgi:hypothetical protein